MRKKILIVITGSIAAYKTLYLIRKLKEKDFFINVIMTNSAKKFITALSVSSLSEKRVYENLFDLTEETEMGHIKLAKMHDYYLKWYVFNLGNVKPRDWEPCEKHDFGSDHKGKIQKCPTSLLTYVGLERL